MVLWQRRQMYRVPWSALRTAYGLMRFCPLSCAGDHENKANDIPVCWMLDNFFLIESR